MAFSGERMASGPNDPIWIGIVTTTPGNAFDSAHAVGFDFRVDPSHSDGYGGLTEKQKNVYVALLKAAIDRLEGKRIINAPGNIPIERMN